MRVNNTLPSFEIVTIEDATYAAAKRLRVYVAIRPEDISQVDKVAGEIVTEHAADNDVVIMFFHFSPASAGKDPAEARAQYVRNGMKQGHVPKPLVTDRGTVKLKTQHGVITVEKARRV